MICGNDGIEEALRERIIYMKRGPDGNYIVDQIKTEKYNDVREAFYDGLVKGCKAGDDDNKNQAKFELFVTENLYLKIYDLTNKNEFYEKVMKTEFKYLKNHDPQSEIFGFAIINSKQEDKLILKTNRTPKDNFYIFGEHQGKWGGLEMSKINALSDIERRIFNHEQLILDYYKNSGNLKKSISDICDGAK
jgi:hypothetical protein